MSNVLHSIDLVRTVEQHRLQPLGTGKVLDTLSVARVRVVSVILVSAAIVLTARLLGPFEIGKDQAVQLEAAQRLAEGLGLTTFSDAVTNSFDIVEAPSPKYLTNWPPAFSVIIAGFLAIGIPLLASLKIVYGVTTLIGWLGWGIAASYFISSPIKLGAKTYHFHLVIAALWPVFITPWWKGTDIFLWAGVPFIALLLSRQSNAVSSRAHVIAAGLLFGFLSATRYGSLFIAPAALLTLFCVSYPRISLFLKRSALFLSSALLFILPVIICTKVFAPSAPGLPDNVGFASDYSNPFSAIAEMLRASKVTSLLVFGSSLVWQTAYHIDSSLLDYTLGIACLLIVFSLPVILLRRATPGIKGFQQNIALSFSLLPISLIVFLIAVRLITHEHLFGIRRYYEPIGLCGVFVLYQIASSRITGRITKTVSTAIVLVFLFDILCYMPAQALLPGRRDYVVQSVLGFTPSRSSRYPSTSLSIKYPSFGIYSEKENTRLIMKRLYEQDRQALFFATQTPLYAYDLLKPGGPALGDNLRGFPEMSYWKRAYTSRAVKVFWVLGSETSIDFIPESNLKTVHIDPVERTKILESDFPAGYRFASD